MRWSSIERVGTPHFLNFQRWYLHALNDVRKQRRHVIVAHSHISHNLLERDLLLRKVFILLIAVELGTELGDFALSIRQEHGMSGNQREPNPCKKAGITSTSHYDYKVEYGKRPTRGCTIDGREGKSEGVVIWKG